ncbi:MAG: hypothetical protein V1836_03580 [Candidatus Aenigmatarchaeota archaeon]
MVDVYAKIDASIKSGLKILGSGKDPVKTIGSATDAYRKAEAELGGIGTPVIGTTDHHKYQLAEKRIEGLKLEIRGYARQSMTERVDNVYKTIRNNDYGIPKLRTRGLNVLLDPVTSSGISESVSGKTEKYRKESEGYVKTVITELDRVGLKEADDDALKSELNRKLAAAKKTLERQKKDYEGAARADAIRKASKRR